VLLEQEWGLKKSHTMVTRFKYPTYVNRVLCTMLN